MKRTQMYKNAVQTIPVCGSNSAPYLSIYLLLLFYLTRAGEETTNNKNDMAESEGEIKYNAPKL